MLRENHVLKEIYAHRFCGPDPKYALVISHGIGGHGGIYDQFCETHAAKGVDIWAYDAPGHGKSTTNRPRGQWTMEEWATATVDFAEHIKAESGLPVFALGSSLGVAAAYSSLHSDAISGAILMGSPAIPSGPLVSAMAAAWKSDDVQMILGLMGGALRLDIGRLFNFDEDYGYVGAGEQKKLDPWNTWSYDLASWASLFTYEPKVPVQSNRKPIHMSCGENDPNFPPAQMQAVADSISGPVEFSSMKDASHQLMLFHTDEYSKLIHEWTLKQI